MNKTLTGDARATIMDACQSISRSADALKAGCSIDGEWPDADDKAFYDAELRLLERLTALLAAQQPEPIDMLLFCPKCGTQHIDGVEDHEVDHGSHVEVVADWTNPSHRSHLCHACGTIWRPADVPTNGVASIQTRGKADTWDGKAEPFTLTSALEWAGVPDVCRKDPEPRAEVTDDDKVCADRYRYLRVRMSFVQAPGKGPSMSLRAAIPAPNHDFNRDFIGDRFDASVDATIDAARAGGA